MELLILLVERRSQLVTRDQIVERLWGRHVALETEPAINTAVRKIRRALADDAEAPRFLETVVGKGYRFVGDVTVVGRDTPASPAAAARSAAPEPSGLTTRPPTRWRGKVMAGMVLGLAALAWATLVWRAKRDGGTESIESLAVLPLENVSGDLAQEYFADGMTDALIATLGKIQSLRVISRTSVMRYKGTRKPLPEIARELNVQVVVVGSVLRSGERMRIAAQLIDASADRHLWSETYERDVRDILALQGEVARAIATEVRIKLTPQEQSRLTTTRPVIPAAHEAYFKGLYEFAKRTEVNRDRALRYFKDATQLDPSYAPAYAALAITHSLYADYASMQSAALKGLELDDTLADAHAALGHARMNGDWDWAGAERELTRAIELDARSMTAHHFYSHLLMARGRITESLAESERALELEPLSAITTEHLGWHYHFARQYERAIEQFKKLLEMEPNFALGHIRLGHAYEQEGMLEEAIAEFSKAMAIRPGSALADLGHLYSRSGKKLEALTIVDQLKSRERPPSYQIALIYVGLRDKEQAFAWLEKAYAERSSFNLMTIGVEPRLDVLRSDPRFRDLLRRVGLVVQEPN